MVHVIEAKYLENYKVWLVFDNGKSGTVDLGPYLKGPIFEPLKDLSQFQQMSYDTRLGTIVWPNGADFAPEFLENLLR